MTTLNIGSVFVILLFVLAGPRGGCQQVASAPLSGYKLVWNDEFSGSRLDTTKWNYRGLGKRDDAYIVRQAVWLDNKGHLVMQVSKSNDSILTAMISTENIFHQRYGYFECRASLTTTPGTFPAFWLQSPSISNEQGSIDSNGAEIDIFEYFPHSKIDSVAHTLHYGGYGAGHRVAGPVWGALKGDARKFHVFGLEWTPDGYKTFVDGVVTYSGNVLVSKVPEFIVLSLGVNTAAAGPLQLSGLPDRFIVDYVRVYQKTNAQNE